MSNLQHGAIADQSIRASVLSEKIIIYCVLLTLMVKLRLPGKSILRKLFLSSAGWSS